MGDEASRRAGRRMWIGIPGPTIDAETRARLERIRPGGVILFARNIESADQVRSLIGELRELCGSHLLLSVDQEGGKVVRFTTDVTVFPGNMALGAVAAADLRSAVDLARAQGECSGSELRDIGFDVNLAPVVDLATVADNPGVGNRAFSVDPEHTAQLAEAIVAGHREYGVLPTLKHFPGTGDALVDPHLDLPVIPGPLGESQLLPFRRGIAAGAPLVMTSHVMFPAVDSELPATLSREMLEGVLRRRLGFAGVIVSDDLGMGALTRTRSRADALRRAASAGCDVLLFAADWEAQDRAFESLRDAYERDESWLGETDATDERLDELASLVSERVRSRPPVSGGVVAQEIAARAVTLLRGESAQVGTAGRVWLVLPETRTETPAEDPLRGERLTMVADSLSDVAEAVFVSAEPDPDDLARLATQVGRRATPNDRVVVALLGARFSAAQRSLVEWATDLDTNVLFALLGDAFDLSVIPASEASAVVCAYGFRPVHQHALLRVMRGVMDPLGGSPVATQPAPHAPRGGRG